MKKYPLHQDDIRVKGEPKPTTSVIPFAKEAVVGKTIHMCFEEGDSVHFYKGNISYYDNSAGTFHIDFFDGDEADIDFVSGGDTILWETQDVTRDGQWPEESSDLDIVPREEEEEKAGMGGLAPVVAVPQEETRADAGQEEVTVQEQEKEDIKKVDASVKKDEMAQPSEEKNDHKKETVQKADDEDTLAPAPSIMDGVVMGKKSPAKPMPSEKQESKPIPSEKQVPKPIPSEKQVLKPQGGVGPADQGIVKTSIVGAKRKESLKDAGVGLKHAKVEKEDGPVKVVKSPAQDGISQRQEKDTPATELKKSINNYGISFLDSLGELKHSIENLTKLSNMIKSFAEKEDPAAIKKTDVPKTARGFLNTAFHGGKKYAVGIENVWPLNDTLMKAVSELYDVTTSLCHTANFPTPKEPDFMKEWKKNQSRADHDARRGQTPRTTVDAENAPKEMKKEQVRAPAKSSTSMKSDHDVEAVTYAKKNEHALFQTTGNLFRDNAIRIFSQSLMSPATPVEIAVDMEQAIFAKCNVQGKDQRLPDDYYTVVKSLWEVLNPASVNCNPLLRIMLLHGYMTHQELLSLREGDLAHVERKFIEDIAENSWLRNSFRRP